MSYAAVVPASPQTAAHAPRIRRDVKHELGNTLDPGDNRVFWSVIVDRGECVRELDRRRLPWRRIGQVEMAREGDVKTIVLP